MGALKKRFRLPLPMVWDPPMHLSGFWRHALSLALIVFAPRSASGQITSDAVPQIDECRLAAQVIRTAEPQTQTAWARGYIAACEEEGPAALVSLWAAAGADSANARFLVFYSSRIRDQRLYDEMRRTAQNPSRPDVVRVAAMLTLARYANPSLAAGFADGKAPDSEITRIPLVAAWRSGSNQLRGAVPVRPNIGPELLQVLTGVAEDRSNSRAVWYAAAVLAKLVRIDVENGWSL